MAQLQASSRRYLHHCSSAPPRPLVSQLSQSTVNSTLHIKPCSCHQLLWHWAFLKKKGSQVSGAGRGLWSNWPRTSRGTELPAPETPPTSLFCLPAFRLPDYLEVVFVFVYVSICICICNCVTTGLPQYHPNLLLLLTCLSTFRLSFRFLTKGT